MDLKIAGLVGDSIVDGPGVRYAIFVQGCPHHCKGCHNQHTWDFNGGSVINIQELFDKIVSNPLLDGVTFSGGEPFCQCQALAELSDMLRKKAPQLNIMAYTGYEIEHLIAAADENNGYLKLLEKLDYLVDGPFMADKKSYELSFRGSSNQRFIDVKRSLQESRAVLAPDNWNDLDIKLI